MQNVPCEISCEIQGGGQEMTVIQKIFYDDNFVLIPGIGQHKFT